MLGATAGYHVPHRFTKVTAFDKQALEKAVGEVTSWSSASIAAYARTSLWSGPARTLDIIITDHHLPDEDEGSPPALAVLNPNQHGCEYPDKNLAGVGVAFQTDPCIVS